METFINRNLYELRYNCNALSVDEWYAQGTQRPYMGVLCNILGIILECVYVPFLITMLQPKFMAMSCYKLMFFLGVMDCTEIVCASLITGYLLLKGAVYCTNPTLIYFTGITGFATWCGSCSTCMILTVNRCIDVYFPEVSRTCFTGWRTWLWLLIPLSIVSWVMGFETTICFNSNHIAWFFDPFYGMDNSLHPKVDTHPIIYKSTLHSVNNIVTVIALCSGNSLLCYYVFTSSGKTTGTSKVKRQFIVQICVICSLVTACSSIYVWMQFFYTPWWLILLGSMSFNLSSGALAMTYLFLNPTLRIAALKLFCRIRSTKVESSVFKAGSASHRPSLATGSMI